MMSETAVTSSHYEFDTRAEGFRIQIKPYDGQFELIGQGKYKHVDRNIGLGTFPMERERSYYAEMAQVGLIREHDYESLRLFPAIERLKERGLTPATAHELLAFGAQCGDASWFPDGWLHALGTVMEHQDVCASRYVLSLNYGKKKGSRSLCMSRMESVNDRSHSAWTFTHRFLVVRRRYIEQESP